MADCSKGEEPDRARIQEGKGALVWKALQTTPFTAGNNFRDESAELLCQALAVRSEGRVPPSPVGDGPGRYGRPRGWLRVQRSEVT